MEVAVWPLWWLLPFESDAEQIDTVSAISNIMHDICYSPAPASSFAVCFSLSIVVRGAEMTVLCL